MPFISFGTDRFTRPPQQRYSLHRLAASPGRALAPGPHASVAGGDVVQGAFTDGIGQGAGILVGFFLAGTALSYILASRNR